MATAAMTPPQGIMALPENDEANAAPEIGIDETYDAVKTGLTQARPDAAADMDAMMAEIIPQLGELDVEQLDALITAIKFLNDNPENYAKNISDMIAEDIIDEGDFPAEFDPEFLATILTVLIEAKRNKTAGAAGPAGMPAQMPAPQGFAKGGIADAVRIVASQGRNGDTMLAHITPEEARMLRSQGGSGTINPQTGLQEYFNPFKAVAKVFKSAVKIVKSTVKAVVGVAKKIVSSPIGRIVATVGLTMIGVPPPLASMLVTKAGGGSWKDAIISGATSYLGSAGSPISGYIGDAAKAVGITSAAGTAALGSGLVGTGIGLLSGQKLSDAVKGGITSSIMAAGTTALAAPASESFDKFKTLFTPEQAAAQATAQPSMGPPTAAQLAAQPAPDIGTPVSTPISMGPPTAAQFAAQPAPDIGTPVSPSYQVPGMVESAKGMGQGIMQMLPGTEGDFSTGLKQFGKGAGDLFAPSGPTPAQITKSAGDILKADTTGKMTYADALKEAKAQGPGIIRSYGPAVAAGIGAMGLMGGFTPGQMQPSELQQKLSGTPGMDLIKGDPSKYLVQGMPGVRYDASGNIIGSSPIDYTVASPTGGGASLASVQYRTPGLAQMQPTPAYTPFTSGINAPMNVSQPYNTSSMYGNIMQPQQRADGGEMRQQGIASLAAGGYPRRTGQISGPGTEKSDDIPAMLSDGEFVMTAKAVRGAGKGSRRAGAKQMYALMHQLEKNASRG
jgi:hypothetical protein